MYAYCVKAHVHDDMAYRQWVPKIKTLKEILGENAKRFRLEKGMSQQDVVRSAAKHGEKIDQTTVGRIERCAHPTTVDTLDALARGLSVPPLALLADSQALPDEAQLRELTPAEADLLARYRATDQRWQLAIWLQSYAATEDPKHVKKVLPPPIKDSLQQDSKTVRNKRRIAR